MLAKLGPEGWRSGEEGISHGEPRASKHVGCGAGQLPPGGPQLEHWVPRAPCQGLRPDCKGVYVGYKMI